MKVLTGDNDLVTRKVCDEVGLPTGQILLGSAVETMSDPQLSQAVETTQVFARLSPSPQASASSKPCAATATSSASWATASTTPPPCARRTWASRWTTAVDIAKESADMILLEKSLMVLEEGVLEGRKVFVNILKYIRMGASSNFGNMFSVLGASALFPFVPMLPIQILTNNLLYDFSQVPIPTDNVGPGSDRQTASVGHRRDHALHPFHRPDQFDLRLHHLCGDVVCLQVRPWRDWLRRRNWPRNSPMPTSTTPTRRALFQTGWFVESLMTQTLIIHVIRTRQIPFIQARASMPLTITTVVIMAVAAWLPYSPLSLMLGFVPLPGFYLADPVSDPALLRGADATGQDVAHSQEVAVITAWVSQDP